MVLIIVDLVDAILLSSTRGFRGVEVTEVDVEVAFTNGEIKTRVCHRFRSIRHTNTYTSRVSAVYRSPFIRVTMIL